MTLSTPVTKLFESHVGRQWEHTFNIVCITSERPAISISGGGASLTTSCIANVLASSFVSGDLGMEAVSLIGDMLTRLTEEQLQGDLHYSITRVMTKHLTGPVEALGVLRA
jgi:hypothetical protein